MSENVEMTENLRYIIFVLYFIDVPKLICKIGGNDTGRSKRKTVTKKYERWVRPHLSIFNHLIGVLTEEFELILSKNSNRTVVSLCYRLLAYTLVHPKM